MSKAKSIDRFAGRFRFLSNFYWSTIIVDDLEYPTVEHAFQAAKTTDSFQRDLIRSASTPAIAKRRGRHAKLQKNWEANKLDVMETLVRKKFQDPELGLALLDTRDAELIEGNSWHDKFWGVYDGEGKNHLGKILMKVREDLRNN